MRNQLSRSCGLLALVLPLPSCSLMGLDDFGASPCVNDSDCANAKAELWSPACGDAICREGLCEWQEGKEICDGKDNDCDGLIDEGLFSAEQTNSSASVGPMDVAYVSSLDRKQTFVAVAGPNGPSEGYALPSLSMNELQYVSAAESPGCPVPSHDTPLGALGTCNFAEVALAADAGHLVVASINTSGCASGQVRVGLSRISDAPFEVWIGKTPGVKSQDECNIRFGVDVDDAGCSGASYGANGNGMPALGATRPAVASLDTQVGGVGALVLWLAAPASPSSTDAHSDSIPVKALGLTVSKETPEWLNGMEGGSPIDLGRSTSLSAPAVLALKSAAGGGKYLVAFPAKQGPQFGIQLLTVRTDGVALQQPDSPEFIADGPADQVSLSLGNMGRDEVGVAWYSGTRPDVLLRFMVVSTSGAPLSGTVSIPTSAPLFAPQLLYRSEGFAEKQPGGWFLSWLAASDDAQKFHIARVHDDEGNLQFLGQSSRQHADIPLLYPAEDDHWGVAYASIHPAGESQSETNPPWCQ